jgi:Holliday junction resolvasome RuvABC ATP-dependent DNA helicase subunit
LIQEGYLHRTPQGRVPTEKAFRKLGVARERKQPELF